MSMDFEDVTDFLEDEDEKDLPPYPSYEDIEVDIWAVLGQAEVRISNLLKIGRGALIDLERDISDNIEIFANGQRVAIAEIVIVEDKLAFRIKKVFRRNLLFNVFPLLNKPREQSSELDPDL